MSTVYEDTNCDAKEIDETFNVKTKVNPDSKHVEHRGNVAADDDSQKRTIAATSSDDASINLRQKTQHYPLTKNEVDEAARILPGTNTTITTDIFELLKLVVLDNKKIEKLISKNYNLQKEVDNLKKTVSTLTTDINHVKIENIKLTENLKSMSSEMERMQNTKDNLNKTVSTLTTDINHVKIENIKLTENLKSMSSEMERMQNTKVKYNKLKNVLETTKKELDTEKDDNSKLKDQINKLKDDNTKLNDEIAQVKAEKSKLTEDLNKNTRSAILSGTFFISILMIIAAHFILSICDIQSYPILLPVCQCLLSILAYTLSVINSDGKVVGKHVHLFSESMFKTKIK